MAQKRINWSSYHIDPKKDNIGVYVSIGKQYVCFWAVFIVKCLFVLLVVVPSNGCLYTNPFHQTSWRCSLLFFLVLLYTNFCSVSTKIPFKGTSKEYVGEDVTEMFQSVKRALQGKKYICAGVPVEVVLQKWFRKYHFYIQSLVLNTSTFLVYLHHILTLCYFRYTYIYDK